MEIAPDRLSPIEVYKILTGSVLPRPIAWVSTVGATGTANLAPFSFFNVASVNPPVLGFSPLLNDAHAEKDTLANIRLTGEFVVNVASRSLAGQMNQTSAPYPAGVSEFAMAGVAAQPSVHVKAPGVRDAMVRFECTLREIISFGEQALAGNLVLGDIRLIHLHPEIYRDGRIDVSLLDPLGRLAGDYFATVRDRFAIARPRSVDPDPTDRRL